MVECGLSRTQLTVLQLLAQNVCLENDEKVDLGTGREYLPMAEWCKMLNTIGLCILAM
jgi:hypothetical protein